MHALIALNWEPQIRGILIIIIAVTVLMGSVFVILGTNLGVRLGFLLSLSALAGWMMLMAMMWWAFGIGLKGNPPVWVAVQGSTILIHPDAVQQAKVVPNPITVAANATPVQEAAAIDTALTGDGWTKLASDDKNYGPSASAGGVEIEADATLKAGQYQVVNVFDKGGERYPKIGESFDFFAFLHKPHWIVVEVAALMPERTEPGRAPAAAEIDQTQPHRYVYMIRDLGNVRVPAAKIAIGSLLVFLATCWLLHTRDRRVNLNRSGGLAVPAKV